MVYDKTEERDGKIGNRLIMSTIVQASPACENGSDTGIREKHRRNSVESRESTYGSNKGSEHFAGGDRITEKAEEWLPNSASRKQNYPDRRAVAAAAASAAAVGNTPTSAPTPAPVTGREVAEMVQAEWRRR